MSNFRHIDKFSGGKLSGVLAAVAACLPLLTLLGWILDLPLMRKLLPGLPSMVPLTAVMLSLLAFSLFLSWSCSRQTSNLNNMSSPQGKFATLFALVPFVAANFTLFGYAFGYEIGLNKFLFVDHVVRDNSTLYSGNMSVQTAAATVLLSTVFILQRVKLTHHRFLVSQIFSLIVVALCLLAFVGYIHDIVLDGNTILIGLSLPTAMTFVILSLGALNLMPDTGLVGRLRGKGSDSFFLRWYAVLSVSLPLMVTAAIAWGQVNRLFPAAFSNALFVLFVITCFLAVGHFMAGAIRRMENQRRHIEQAESLATLQQTEENLTETKEHLELALQASRMGTWESSLIDGSERWSFATREITGFTPTEESKFSTELISRLNPEDIAAFLDERRRCIETRQSFQFDFRFLRADGEMRWLRSIGRAKYDVSGTPVKLVGTLVDVSDEKNYQETLKQALDEANSANQLKSSFLANMSHEIRTPLAAVLGFTELLSGEVSQDAEKAQYIEIILRNGRMLSHLINDILDLSKVEAGRLDIEEMPFSLKDTVGGVLDLLRAPADLKGVNLSVSYTDDVPQSIVSDPMRLKQILMNLIGNAVKFTEKGKVHMQVCVQNEKQICFEIQDTGIGIASAHSASLFQPFSQADGSTTRRFGGTGLGLVLSKRLASLLGGDVYLKHSTPGVGTCFVATIRHTMQSQESLKSENSNATPGHKAEARLTGVRVLLAEDSIDNQRLISRFLSVEGASIDIANNGQECLQKIASAKTYDLVLMDIQMPILDGYETTEQLRRQGYSKPIVAITAHAMSDMRQKCIKSGCDGHLSKPIDRVQLVQTILEFVKPTSNNLEERLKT